jgi:hypothetical protein
MLDNWVIQKHEEPWPYLIIDNFYDKKTWDYVQENLVHNPKEYFTQWPERWGRTSRGLTYGSLHREIDRENRLSYEPHEDPIITNYFLEHTGEDFMKKHFKTYRSYTELGTYVAVKYHHEQYRHMSIHDESSDKVMTILTYLNPEYNIGTIVYDKDKNFHHVVTWKKNRAIVMCAIDGVTWHDCMSSEPSSPPKDGVIGNTDHRITIDCFLTRPDNERCLPMYSVE